MTRRATENIMAAGIDCDLETMAFMMAMPPEDELPIPDKSILVHMDFTGTISGRAEILAGIELIEMIAANIIRELM